MKIKRRQTACVFHFGIIAFSLVYAGCNRLIVAIAKTRGDMLTAIRAVMVPTTFNQKRVFGHKSTAMRTSCYPYGQVFTFTPVIQCLLLFFRQTMQTFFCHIISPIYLNIFEYNGNQFTNQSYIENPNAHSQPMVKYQTEQTIYNHSNQPTYVQTNQSYIEIPNQ